MHDDYLSIINIETLKLFDAIQVEHIHEHGNVFEIALCKLLRLVVPEKYNICRGYIVTSDNHNVGDDREPSINMYK